MPDQIDSWLDAAMADYANVHAPLGFEARVITRLRERKKSRTWMWPAVVAAGIAIAVFTVIADRTNTVDLPSYTVRIAVPPIQRTSATVAAPRTNHQVLRAVETRGVPIVSAPVTAQEEAILRVTRNARAKQLASFATDRTDLTQEKNLLEIQELDFPPVAKREDKQ
jgi:hypothetical protein